MATTKTPDNKDALRVLAAVAPPIDMESVPLPGDQTVACIAREVNFVVPKATAAAVAELQSAFEATQALQIAHNSDGARRAYAEQNERLDADVAGNKDVTKRDSWTEQDFREDFQLKFLAYREQTRRISAQAHAASLPLAEGFAERATALADRLEAQEIEVAARFCTQHVPSDSVLFLKKMADHVLKSSHGFDPKSGASPKSIFSHLPVSFEPSEK